MKTTTQKKTKAFRQMNPQERFHEAKIALLMKVRRVKRATAEAIIRAQHEKRLEQKNEEDEKLVSANKPSRRVARALKGSSLRGMSAKEFFDIG